MICPNCKHKIPDSIAACWYCGEPLSSELRKMLGKNSLEKLVELQRNPTFLDREQKRLLGEEKKNDNKL